jgi:Uma2 family endonuclease
VTGEGIFPMPLAASVLNAPLLEGDSLTSEEFLRRWEEIEDLKHAELIDGIVYMPSPVSLPHRTIQFFLGGWLDDYASATPGCDPGMEGTWLMGASQVPQPDLEMRILPEYGGQSRVEGLYPWGAPELVAEVAVSSRSRDFGAKKRLYERAGVREYLIAVPPSRDLVAFSLTGGGFQPFETGTDGIFRSRCFPGLWLDTKAVWDLDRQRRNVVLEQGLATPEHAEFAASLAARRRESEVN